MRRNQLTNEKVFLHSGAETFPHIFRYMVIVDRGVTLHRRKRRPAQKERDGTFHGVRFLSTKSAQAILRIGFPHRHSPFSEFLTLSTVFPRLGLVALFHTTSALRIQVFRALFRTARGWHLSMLLPLLTLGQRNSRFDPREIAPETGNLFFLQNSNLSIRMSPSSHQQCRQSTSTRFRPIFRLADAE